MISKNLIKEIILSNRAFILESVSGIVPRAAAEVAAPGKTVIMHGIRRSGKTFILYDIFRRNSDAALYLDFEDDRLTGFTAADFQTVQDAFLVSMITLIEPPMIAVMKPVERDQKGISDPLSD